MLVLLTQGAQAQSRATSAIIPDTRADQKPPTSTPSTAAVPSSDEAPAVPDVAPFRLERIVVTGSTLPAETVTAAYQPYIGRMIDRAQLQAITNAIAAVYAHSNIALYTVLVPDQDSDQGVLQLAVVEGYVQRGVVRGANAKMRRLVGRYLAPILQERPLTTATLQRYVSLIREIPGLYPDLDFERGDRPGAVRLVIAAKPKPFQIGLGINDRGTALLGRTQGEVDGYANSLLAGGDQLRLTAARPIRAPYYQSYSGTYAVPLNADGLTLQLTAGTLRTRPKALPIKGSATSLGGQLSLALLRSFRQSLTLSAELDGVNSDNAFLGFTFSNERTRAVRLAAAYSLAGSRYSLSASVTGSAGLNALGARLLDHELSEADFRKLNLRLSGNLSLGRDFVARIDTEAQVSGDRVPATEQLALGGDEFGRAFETAITSGDRGYAGSAELAFHPAEGLPKAIAGSELYVFIDGGKLRYHARFGEPGIGSHLASIGGGARLAVASRVSFGLEAVRALNNPVFYEDRQRWRLLFSARSLF